MRIIVSFILLLFSIPVFAMPPFVMNSGVQTQDCNLNNDSSIWSTNQDGDTTKTATWRAQKITLAAETTVTSYLQTLCEGNQTGSVTMVLMNHDSGNDYPDETSEVANTDSTVTAANISDCYPVESTEFDLASPTLVSSGTYWIVVKEIGGISARTYTDSSSSGDRYCYSEDSGSTWTCSDNVAMHVELWGCQ